MAKLDRGFARQIATRLTAEAASHPDFFAEVALALEAQGYKLHIEQRGIEGCHIQVIKLKESTSHG